MITINRYEKNNNDYDTSEALLIIGKGQNEFKNKALLKANDLEEVEEYYGKNSDLTNAFKEAVDIGADNIFLCNCFKFTDYIEIVDILDKFSFAYITPIFNFSETFSLDENKTMYLSEYYSNNFNDELTQLIFTDQHASLFEDINHFIKNMNNITMDFRENSNLLYGENMCFVLNNLKEYKYANVALASILMQNDLNVYPYKDVGDVVFDINSYDVYGLENVYFSYDEIAKTSIENFLNFREKQDAEKFVPVNLVKQKIKRKLDFSEYEGQLFSPYMRISLENKVNTIMNQFVGSLIESFKLINISFTPNQDRSLIITINLSIKPYVSIEEINMYLEV